MQRIDRKLLVTRHNPVLRQAETLSPLSVGNGEFAYTVDITGMQSFPDEYKFPLGTSPTGDGTVQADMICIDMRT